MKHHAPKDYAPLHTVGARITGIMAATEAGVVGRANGLPWDYPEELDHFRQTTAGQVVIMGRKTFDGIPEIFHTRRTSIVLSRNLDLKCEFAKVVHCLDESIEVANKLSKGKAIYMIGGADVAGQFLERGLLSSFILTKIREPFEGDVRLDLQPLKGWSESERQTALDYTIVSLEKPYPPAP